MDPPTQHPTTLREALALKASRAVKDIFHRASGFPARIVGLAQLIEAAVTVGARQISSSTEADLIASAFATAVGTAAKRDLGTLVEQNSAWETEADKLLSPMAQAAIAQARYLAAWATKEDFIAARHLIVALVAPSRSDLRGALRRVWRAQWDIDPQVLYAPLREVIARDVKPNEDPRAWASLNDGARVARFIADAAAAPRIDPLGHAEEARRLAELACHVANTPPMAVALFGDWGSGKSTFMKRMQEAVEEIGSTWKQDPDPPFATRVAQIRFNAWTYADGDLWASLAAEIFRQLRREIARLSGEAVAGAQYRALLDRVALRLGATETAQSAALGELAQINRALDAKRGELERVERRAAEIAASPAAERLMERAQAALRDKPEAVGAALRTLGIASADDAARLTALVGEARQATDAAGRLRLLGRTLRGMVIGPDAMLWLGAAGLALLLWWVVPGVLANAGPAVAALAGLRAVWSRMAPILDAAYAFAEAESAERASLAARRTALEAEIAALRKQRAEKESAQTQQASFLARHAGAARGESPAALLRFFLEEDEGLRRYEQRLGLVSRLRESFETLQAILAEQAGRAAEPAVEQVTVLGATIPVRPVRGPVTFPAIDRIILYVDDLDRCQPAQVVPVLQALALMLQLELFVAVVAVDDRWLKAALRVHYKELLHEQAMGSPKQFLEKIFQIPFWLRPMTRDNDQRYAAFVAHLAPEVAAPEAAPEPPPGDGFDAGAALRPFAADQGPYHLGFPGIDPDELPRDGGTDAYWLDQRRETVERVSLTEPEVAVLTALAPLAGGTPRAVKRFVNLYRLARSSRDGAALDAWLGKGGAAPAFPAMAFALACHCGLDGPALRAFLRIRAGAQDTTISAAWPALRTKLAFRDGPVTDPDASISEAALEAIGAAIARLGAVAKMKVGVAQLVAAWPEAARFSFNRPPPAFNTQGIKALTLPPT
jgi:cell division protein FtsB